MASQLQRGPRPAPYCSKSPPEQPLQVKVVGLQKLQLSHREERCRGNREKTASADGSPVSSGSRFLVTRVEVRGRREVALAGSVSLYLPGVRVGSGGRSTTRRATFKGGSEQRKIQNLAGRRVIAIDPHFISTFLREL